MRKRNAQLEVLISLAVILALIGLWIALTPTINRIEQKEQAASEIEAFYEERAEAASRHDHNHGSYEAPVMPLSQENNDGTNGTVYSELLAAMQAYNDQIYADRQAGLTDPWAYTAPVLNLTDYGLTSDAPVGVLTIQKMDFEEPVYLGATMEHLARGAAQLSISSMPIGGVNTNCVLAGHRGWQGALHFRHIELLEVGDEIQLTNLWEVLKYRVVEIKIIQPWQAEELLIQEGRDLLTLCTCHPYGSGGKYRYIVYCERKE